jgi:hypothetical protein
VLRGGDIEYRRKAKTGKCGACHDGEKAFGLFQCVVFHQME